MLDDLQVNGERPGCEPPAADAEPDWAHLIPDADWSLYRPVLEAALQRGTSFAIGGGFAFSAYARRWRNTKDLDLYILPRDAETMKEVIHEQGFRDYYEREPYDRAWIYRAYREPVIIDLIWASANQYRPTDELWMSRSRRLQLRGLDLRLLPLEELVFSKLYVLQRERCDWPDLLNILHAQGPAMDWDHLLHRLGEDAPLLGALLHVFGWVCGAQARALPDWLWDRVGLQPPRDERCCSQDQRRIRLLDSRDWFGPHPGPR